MRFLLAAALILCSTQSFAKCVTFTDGECIFDFEFHDNVNIYAKDCRVWCDEGLCTFECLSPPYLTTVFDTDPPLALDQNTGEMKSLEPLCKGYFLSPVPKHLTKLFNRFRSPHAYRFYVRHSGVDIGQPN
jgi:hypothetical protein